MRLTVLIPRLLIVLPSLYVAFLAALLHPRVQIALVTLHWVRWPFRADYARPERFGYGVGRVRHLYITAGLESLGGSKDPSEVKLGSWLILAQSPWEKLRDRHGAAERFSDGDVNFAFQQRPTVLYLHGNAASRAAEIRLRSVQALLALDVNVLIVDYRGFADSSRHLPTEAGLNTDARAAWDWLAKRAAPQNIAIVAQSLGTGIASALAADLALQGVTPRAVILVAPFTSIAELLQTYRLFKTIPILGLVRHIPGAESLMNRFLDFQFRTVDKLPSVRSSILLVHAADDIDVHPQHSATLFDALAKHSEAQVKSEQIGYDEIGSLRSFKRSGGAGDVMRLELPYGQHNAVGYHDEAVRLFKKVLNV